MMPPIDPQGHIAPRKRDSHRSSSPTVPPMTFAQTAIKEAGLKRGPLADPRFLPASVVIRSKELLKVVPDPKMKQVVDRLDVKSNGGFSRLLSSLVPQALFSSRFPLASDFQYYIEANHLEIGRLNPGLTRTESSKNQNDRILACAIATLKTMICQFGVYTQTVNPSLFDRVHEDGMPWSELAQDFEQGLEEASELYSDILKAIAQSVSGGKLSRAAQTMLINKRQEPVKNILQCIQYMQDLTTSENTALILTRQLATLTDRSLQLSDYEVVPKIILNLFDFVIGDFNPIIIEGGLSSIVRECKAPLSNEKKAAIVNWLNGMKGDMECQKKKWEIMLQKKKITYNDMSTFLHGWVDVNTKFLDCRWGNHTSADGLRLECPQKGEVQYDHLVIFLSGMMNTSLNINRLDELLKLMQMHTLLKDPKFDKLGLSAMKTCLEDLDNLLVVINEFPYFEFLYVHPWSISSESNSNYAGLQKAERDVAAFITSMHAKYISVIAKKWKESALIKDVLERIEHVNGRDVPDPKYLRVLLKLIKEHVLDDLGEFSVAWTLGILPLMQNYSALQESLKGQENQNPLLSELIEMSYARLNDLNSVMCCSIIAALKYMEIHYHTYLLEEEKLILVKQTILSLNLLFGKCSVGEMKLLARGAEHVGQAVPSSKGKSEKPKSKGIINPERKLEVSGVDKASSVVPAVEVEVAASRTQDVSPVSVVCAKENDIKEVESEVELALLSASTQSSPLSDQYSEDADSITWGQHAKVEKKGSEVLDKDKIDDEETAAVDDFFNGTGPMFSKDLKLRNVLPLLKKYGWFLIRTKGSHMQFQKPQDASAGTISVPKHGTLGIGLAKKIVNAAKV